MNTARNNIRLLLAGVLLLLMAACTVATRRSGVLNYYLLEELETDSLTLLVYNTSHTPIQYDRAMFIFGPNGVLQEMSVSAEALPGARKAAEKK